MIFEWRCGTCPNIVTAPNLGALRTAVLDHIRYARRGGETEPRCGHCDEIMGDDEGSVYRHTYFDDDADPSIGPRCGYIRRMEMLIL